MWVWTRCASVGVKHSWMCGGWRTFLVSYSCGRAHRLGTDDHGRACRRSMFVLCAADGSGRKVYLIYVVSIFVATAVRLSRDVGAVSSSSRSSMPSAAGDEALTKAVRAAALALTLAFTLTYDRLLISGSRVPGQSVLSASLSLRFRSFWAPVGDRSTWPAWSASSRFPCGRRA